MKYFLIAGEASGDLHASNLMRELCRLDPEASFRFLGGDRMAEVGGEPVVHCRDMAYMGVIAVLIHARSLLDIMDRCKREIEQWKPDVVILVDYASFNLRIARFVKEQIPNVPVHFYISPKLWAWKTYRIRSFKRYIDHLFVILPFEPAFFEKYCFKAKYVGNPSVDSVSSFLLRNEADEAGFRKEHGLDERPILALLPGSRRAEIKGNLPVMLEVAARFPEFQVVVAGAPGGDAGYYAPYMPSGTPLLFDATYPLLQHAYAALVTSGTATLETALFSVPQVVCFAVGSGYLANWIFKTFMKVSYISLVNLIVGKELVAELMGGDLTPTRLTKALGPLLRESPERKAMLDGYASMRNRLGGPGAALRTAEGVIAALQLNR